MVQGDIADDQEAHEDHHALRGILCSPWVQDRPVAVADRYQAREAPPADADLHQGGAVLIPCHLSPLFVLPTFDATELPKYQLVAQHDEGDPRSLRMKHEQFARLCELSRR